METLQWDESLSVGVELIDQQHQMLIKRLDDFATATKARHGTTQVVKTLTFLIEYTEFHFDAEEKHMTQCGYPGLEDHHAKHKDLKTTLAGLEQDFREDGATQTLAEAIYKLMVNWLVKHIREVDVQFGSYLKDNGITLSEVTDLLGMAFSVMEDEATGPVDIRLLRSIGIVFGPKGEPQVVEHTGRLVLGRVDCPRRRGVVN